MAKKPDALSTLLAASFKTSEPVPVPPLAVAPPPIPVPPSEAPALAAEPAPNGEDEPGIVVPAPIKEVSIKPRAPRKTKKADEA